MGLLFNLHVLRNYDLFPSIQSYVYAEPFHIEFTIHPLQERLNRIHQQSAKEIARHQASEGSAPGVSHG